MLSYINNPTPPADSGCNGDFMCELGQNIVWIIIGVVLIAAGIYFTVFYIKKKNENEETLKVNEFEFDNEQY